MEIQTLSEAGYTGRPYIHNASHGTVCFVWFSKSDKGRICQDLAWTVFRLIRSSGKLVKADGHLVQVMVPTEHYHRSLAELYALAQVGPPTYKLRKGKKWIGPVLYMDPGEKPQIGQKGLNYLLMDRAPVKSDGVPLSYGIGPGFTPVLQVGSSAQSA